MKNYQIYDLNTLSKFRIINLKCIKRTCYILIINKIGDICKISRKNGEICQYIGNKIFFDYNEIFVF